MNALQAWPIGVALLVLPVTTMACGAASPTTATAKPLPPATSAAPAPPVAPLDCNTLCAKANTVTGCATPPENVPACVDLCTRMLAGACKTQVEAELACAARITLTCKPEGTVDWGACSAEQRAANECARVFAP